MMRLERLRREDVARGVDAASVPSAPVGAAFLGHTTHDLEPYPTAAASVYRIEALGVDQGDQEGDSFSLSPIGYWVNAVNIGTEIPDEDTVVVVHSIGGRYVFCYGPPMGY